jgi:phage/plasmid-like protein (TIGR03299 family)
MTAEEALNAAYLANWNVRKRPLWVDVREDDQQVRGLVVPRQYATVFDNPVTKTITPIGVVGERYTPIQNEALTEFADALVAESGAHYETGGSLRDYSQVFLTMKLPQTFILEGKEGQDVTEYYLGLFNSHDGNSALFGVITPVRVVCANTAAVAIKGAHSRFSVPHTSGWANAVEEARKKLGLTLAYQKSFEDEVRELFAQPFSTEEAKGFIEELTALGQAEMGSATATRRQNEANAILKLFVESPTIAGTPVAGTKWGAFNAVSEYVDHFQSVRGGKDDVEVEGILRATRTLTSAASSSSGLKVSAWQLLTN